MSNLFPGTEQTERYRIKAGPNYMLQRCPICHADVDALVIYDHLLKADFEWARIIRPWDVRQRDYMMTTYIVEPCNHSIVVPVGVPACTIHATLISLDTNYHAEYGPPYLVLWPKEAERKLAHE